MLYLHPDSLKIQKARKEFYDGIFEFILKRISRLEDQRGEEVATLFGGIFRSLIEPNFDEILLGKPKTLVRINRLINPFIKRWPNLRSGIEYVFNYDRFIYKTSTRYDAYDLAKALDIRTCTYCNRNYTTTVIKRDGKKITRPQFDHYFDKAENPLLALSFYNLIPCCSTCNSAVKGSQKFTLENFLNPYKDDSTHDISFSYKFTNQTKSGLKIIVDTPNDSKAENTVKAFAIEEIYNSHIGVLKDLLRTKQYFSDRYIEILKSNLLKGIIISEEDIYRMLFGTELNADNFVNRPFSKFKKDILSELNIIE